MKVVVLKWLTHVNNKQNEINKSTEKKNFSADEIKCHV